MNRILGIRIRYLRELKGFTQEQVAEKMNCTRQKYARIEKGLVDITYVNITDIAQILGTSTEEITSAINNTESMQPIFRTDGNSIKPNGFEYINNMIDTFYAHRNLYNSVRQVDGDE